VVEINSVEVAGAPPGVTELVLNLMEEAFGGPLVTFSETLALKTGTGVTVT